MLEIIQLFTHGFFKKDIERFESAGFRIRSETYGVAGWQVSRFIDFEKGPSLEFIEVINETEYIESLPSQIRPYASGLYLDMMSGSQKAIQDYEKELIHLMPFIVHVNYDEKLETRGPGWNFLNFEKPVIKDTVIGLRECELPQPQQKLAQEKHPNGVYEVVGVAFNLKKEEIRSLLQLAKADDSNAIPSINGIQVFTKESFSPLSGKEKKRFPLIAVVLKAETFRYFETMETKPLAVSFQSRDARILKTRELSFDVIIVT